ncbi:unnamed protein product [Oikopleura dioica]|uniref:Uncharacterized protein n=1 Tax=Oikopleura dioica TaxID=34765 RepID=E4X9I5_OIKDI|nr:unnamed protein product [Oikopleura dioica]
MILYKKVYIAIYIVFTLVKANGRSDHHRLRAGPVEQADPSNCPEPRQHSHVSLKGQVQMKLWEHLEILSSSKSVTYRRDPGTSLELGTCWDEWDSISCGMNSFTTARERHLNNFEMSGQWGAPQTIPTNNSNSNNANGNGNQRDHNKPNNTHQRARRSSGYKGRNGKQKKNHSGNANRQNHNNSNNRYSNSHRNSNQPRMNNQAVSNEPRRDDSRRASDLGTGQGIARELQAPSHGSVTFSNLSTSPVKRTVGVKRGAEDTENNQLAKRTKSPIQSEAPMETQFQESVVTTPLFDVSETISVADLRCDLDAAEPVTGTLHPVRQNFDYLTSSSWSTSGKGQIIRHFINLSKNLIIDNSPVLNSLSDSSRTTNFFSDKFILSAEWWPPGWQGSRYKGHLLTKVSLEVFERALLDLNIPGDEVSRIYIVDANNSPVQISAVWNKSEAVVRAVLFHNIASYLKFAFFAEQALANADPLFNASRLPFWDGLFLPVKDQASGNCAFTLVPNSTNLVQSFLNRHLSVYWLFTSDPDHRKCFTFAKHQRVHSVIPLRHVFDRRLRSNAFGQLDTKSVDELYHPLCYTKSFEIIFDLSSCAKSRVRQTVSPKCLTIMNSTKREIVDNWFVKDIREYIRSVKNRSYREDGTSRGDPVTIKVAASDRDFGKDEGSRQNLRNKTLKDLARVVDDSEFRSLITKVVEGTSTVADIIRVNTKYQAELKLINEDSKQLREATALNALESRIDSALHWEVLRDFAAKMEEAWAGTSIRSKTTFTDICQETAQIATSMVALAQDRVRDPTVGQMIPANFPSDGSINLVGQNVDIMANHMFNATDRVGKIAKNIAEGLPVTSVEAMRGMEVDDPPLPTSVPAHETPALEDILEKAKISSQRTMSVNRDEGATVSITSDEFNEVLENESAEARSLREYEEGLDLYANADSASQASDRTIIINSDFLGDKELGPTDLALAEVSTAGERSLPHGPTGIMSDEQAQTYFDKGVQFKDIEAFIHGTHPSCFPTVGDYHAFVKSTLSRKRQIDRSLTKAQNASKSSKIVCGVWLNYFSQHCVEIIQGIETITVDRNSRVMKDFNLPNFDDTKPKWLAFAKECQEFLREIQNWETLCAYAMVFPEGLYNKLPIAFCPQLVLYVRALLANSDVVSVKPSQVCVARLNAMGLVAVNKRSHAGVYMHHDPNEQPNIPEDQRVITGSFVKVSDNDRHIIRQMVAETIRAVYIRDFGGEFDVTLAEVVRKSKENGILKNIIEELISKVIDNDYMGFSTWMTDPEYVNSFISSGLCKPKEDELDDDDNCEHSELPNSMRHWNAWSRGIVPRSIIDHDIPDPEQLASLNHLKGVLSSNTRCQKQRPKAYKDIPVTGDLEGHCLDHNDTVKAKTVLFNVITCNLGSVGMNKIHEMIQAFPDREAYCISELYIENKIIMDQTTWPNGYSVIASEPSPIGALSFSCIIYKNHYNVKSIVKGIHQNTAITLEVNDQIITLSSFYNFNIGGKYNGYETKFGEDRNILLKDLEKVKSHEGGNPNMITGDLNVCLSKPRAGEGPFCNKINVSLSGFENLVDFDTFSRISKSNKILKKSSSQIDHVLVRGCEAEFCRPLNMPAILGNDGHQGIEVGLSIRPKNCNFRHVWMVPHWADEDVVYRAKKEKLWEGTMLKMAAPFISAEEYVSIAQSHLNDYVKKVQPLKKMIIETDPFKPITSPMTKKYYRASEDLSKTVLSAIRDSAPINWIRKLRSLQYKINLVIHKLHGADKRLHFDKMASEKEMDLNSSWVIYNKAIKQLNKKSVSTDLETTSDLIAQLQHSSPPEKVLNPDSLKFKILEREQRYQLESFRMHKCYSGVPSFMSVYKTTKQSTRDVHNFNMITSESLDVATIVMLICTPVKLSLAQGTYFDTWKCNKITPLLKASGKIRPIVVATFTAAFAEKLVGRGLAEFFELRKLIPDFQFGFKKSHSCGSAIFAAEKFLDSAVLSLNGKGEPVAASHGVLSTCDAANAFGVVVHDLLLRSLEGVVGDKALSWFAGFLPRSFRVALRGFLGPVVKLPGWGCPQGASPSPVLYSFYTRSVLTLNSEVDPGEIPAVATTVAARSNQTVGSVENEDGITPEGHSTPNHNNVEPGALDSACTNPLHYSIQTRAGGTAVRGEKENTANPFPLNTMLGSEGCLVDGKLALSSRIVFADDVISLLVSNCPVTLRKLAAEKSSEVLASLTALGIRTCPHKAESCLFSKSLNDENFSLVIEGHQVSIKKHLRYLGVQIESSGRKLSYDMHFRMLKGRFRSLGERVSLMKNICDTSHMAQITRSILYGVLLHAQDFVSCPSTSDLRIFQNIYKRSCRGYQQRNLWKLKLMSAGGKDNIEKAAPMPNSGLRAVKGLEYLDSLNHSTLAIMTLKQSIATIFKVFRFRQPVTASESLANCFWITNGKGKKLVHLPDTFEWERLERKANLESRFTCGRTPGFTTAEENREIAEKRLFARQVASLLFHPELEVRAFIPSTFEKPFIVKKTQWPYCYFEEFNRLPRYLRNLFPTSSFPHGLKEFSQNAHRHWQAKFYCNVCDMTLRNLKTKMLPIDPIRTGFVRPSLREPLISLMERERLIQGLRKEICWEEVILLWWFPYASFKSFYTADSFFLHVGHEASTVKEALKDSTPTMESLVKQLCEFRGFGRTINSLLFDCLRRDFQKKVPL